MADQVTADLGDPCVEEFPGFYHETLGITASRVECARSSDDAGVEEMTNATRWRDQPITPTDFDDLRSLVKLARSARERVVEFDWVLPEEDLRSLQRAVYEWGVRVTGRYRFFDSKVLTAIRSALNDTATPCVLAAPSKATNIDCAVSCVRVEDAWRVSGHATFDMVMGYGHASVNPSVTGSAYLSARARSTLFDSVDRLGWNLMRLREPHYRAVWNAMFNLPLRYGTRDTPKREGDPIEAAVHFHGPFSAFSDNPAPCLFTDPVSARSGIYLWTVNVLGEERPWYVGQTRRTFGQRIGEHIGGILSGAYTLFDGDALEQGILRNIGPKDRMWPQTLPEILLNYATFAPHMRRVLRVMRFFVATLDKGTALHDRIEGAIGRHYKRHPDSRLRDFFYPGIKLPGQVPYDLSFRVGISSDAPLAGMPAVIEE